MQLSLDAAMERTFGVAEFAQLVSDVIEHSFPHDVWIQGEVRDMRRTRSGHVYFSLVDPTDRSGERPDATLSVVLFDGTRRTINAHIKRAGGGLRIDDGVAVRIRGIPEFYVPQGRLNLRMTAIDPEYTIGLLAASRERLLRTLSEEGLLDKNSSLVLPPAPLRVGLVTASGSAAHADFIDELSSAGIGFHVVFAPSPVQGDDAPRHISAAIRTCEIAGVEVIAVVRGGGARTDLIAFDDELVARAIAGCGVPVLTGIGHEIDTSVADEVAYHALKTPTACAGHLAALALDADRRTSELWRHISTRSTAVLQHHSRAVSTATHAARRSVHSALRRSDLATSGATLRVRDLAAAQLDRAGDRLETHGETVGMSSRHRLANAAGALHRQANRVTESSRQRLRENDRQIESAAVRARLLDPARVLARGWSITTDAAGSVVRSPGAVAPGAQLRTRVAGGTIVSTVDEPNEDEEPS
ncbi:MAG: exodeoxyribonuclease VII large subunit [Acidimicrobiales bacterium]